MAVAPVARAAEPCASTAPTSPASATPRHTSPGMRSLPARMQRTALHGSPICARMMSSCGLASLCQRGVWWSDMVCLVVLACIA